MNRYRAISAFFIACFLLPGLAYSSAPSQPAEAPDAAQDVDRSDWSDESADDQSGAKAGLRGSGSQDAYGRIGRPGADNDAGTTTAFISASQMISVDIDDPVVGESCTSDDIADTIDARHNAVRYCYERQVQGDLELSGEFTLHFEIEPTGDPVSVEVVGSSFDDSAVEDCVIRVAERLQFSERGGETSCSVEVSMSFSRDLPLLGDDEE